jgi:CheY-like chemotaxis protein
MTEPSREFAHRSDPPPKDQSSAPRRADDTGKRRRPRILIVEDHQDTREMYVWCMRARTSDQRTAHIPIVACTAFGKERRADIRAAGIDDLVPKPATGRRVRARFVRA